MGRRYRDDGRPLTTWGLRCDGDLSDLYVARDPFGIRHSLGHDHVNCPLSPDRGARFFIHYRKTLNLVSIMGVIMLVGIVVK